MFDNNNELVWMVGDNKKLNIRKLFTPIEQNVNQIVYQL